MPLDEEREETRCTHLGRNLDRVCQVTEWKFEKLVGIHMHDPFTEVVARHGIDVVNLEGF